MLRDVHCLPNPAELCQRDRRFLIRLGVLLFGAIPVPKPPRALRAAQRAHVGDILAGFERDRVPHSPFVVEIVSACLL